MYPFASLKLQKKNRIKKLSALLLILYCSIVLGYWFAVKILHLNALFYTSDIFTWLEMFKSFLDGYPFSFEYQYGRQDLIHNTYSPYLLFSIPVYLFGAYGLFAAHLILYFISFMILLKKYYLRYDLFSLYFVFVLFLGPISFWLIDNPVYGWHPELIYVPLVLIFTVFVLSHNKPASILMALVIILVKENGIILIYSILGFYFLINDINKKGFIISKKILYLTGVCILIFVLGLFFLAIKNNNPEPRLLRALIYLKVNLFTKSFWIYSFKVILSNYGLLFFIFPPLYYKFGFTRKFVKVCFLVFLMSLPIFISGFVEGMYYYPSSFMNLGWPPRFSLSWAYGLSIQLVFLKTYNFNKYRFSLLSALLLFFCFFLQIFFLQFIREYYFIKEFLPVSVSKQKFLPNDFEILKSLADTMNKTKRVYIKSDYFGLFHKQYVLWKQEDGADYIIIINKKDSLKNHLPFKLIHSSADLKIYKK